MMKIKNLRRTSAMTQDWGVFSPQYAEIFYNKATNTIVAIEQYDPEHSKCTTFDDDNIIPICKTSYHMSMLEIANEVHNYLLDLAKETK